MNTPSNNLPERVSRGRRVLGWSALVLGGAGVLAALAGLVGVGVLVSRIRQPVDRVFGEITSISTRLEQGSSEVNERIQISRVAAENLNERIRTSLVEVLEEAGVDVELIQNLKKELSMLTQRLEDWRTFAEMVAELVRQFMQVADSVLAVFHTGLTAGEDLQAALDQGRAQLGEVQGVLKEIETALDNLAHEPQDEGNRTRFDPLFVEVDELLTFLQRHCTAFATGVQRLEQDAAHLQRRIHRALRLGALAATLLLLWQGAAQTCLASWGWRYACPARDLSQAKC